MNASEFMQEEIMKAKTSVITLVRELSKFDSRMTFPMKPENKVRVDLDLWNDLFISSDKAVYHVCQDVKNGKWKLKEKPLFSGKHYSCMTSFIVDGVKYAAAGYGRDSRSHMDYCGFDVTNLAEDEESRERKYVRINLDSNRGFYGIGILRGDTVYDVSLVGSYPEAGIIKAPLEELVEKDTLTVGSNNRQKYILYDPRNKQQHVPLKVHKNKLYLGQGKKVVVLSAAGKVEAEMEIPSHGNIKVIEVDDEGNVFSGTDNGMIYRNQEIFYAGDGFRSVTQMCCGEFDGRKGLFFTGELEHGGKYTVLFRDSDRLYYAKSEVGLMDFGRVSNINIVLLTGTELVVDNQRVTFLRDSDKSNLKFKKIYVGGS